MRILLVFENSYKMSKYVINVIYFFVEEVLMLTTIFFIAVILFLFTGKMDLAGAGCLYILFKIGVPVLLVLVLLFLI